MLLAGVAIIGVALVVAFMDGIIRLARDFGFVRFAVFLYGFYAVAMLIAWTQLAAEVFGSATSTRDGEGRLALYALLLLLPVATVFLGLRGWRQFQIRQTP